MEVFTVNDGMIRLTFRTIPYNSNLSQSGKDRISEPLYDKEVAKGSRFLIAATLGRQSSRTAVHRYDLIAPSFRVASALDGCARPNRKVQKCSCFRHMLFVNKTEALTAFHV